MIETPRLRLRAWRDEDVAAQNAISSDARVAATLGPPPSMERSREVVERQNGHLSTHGFCLWAMELRERPGLIGWCGLQPGKPPIDDEIEIGWTLHPDQWGAGLATEGATACLAWAWSNTPLEWIAAITTLGNQRSRGVMQRLGMAYVENGDFDHPAFPEGDPLRRHVLYRIKRPQ